MATYKIIGKTNGWIASRDSSFAGKTEITLYSGMSLKDAKKKLLSMLCWDYDCYFPNWGVAMNSKIGRDNVSHYNDGTYSYWWDSRTYWIVEEEQEDEI